MDATSQPPTEIFKALSDPVRWSIIMQMAAVDELACVTLEDTLTVSKPTISYHTKILYHAGLISVRKSGRNYYYSLRRDVLHSCSTTCGSWRPRRGPWSARRTGTWPWAVVRSGKRTPCPARPASAAARGRPRPARTSRKPSS